MSATSTPWLDVDQAAARALVGRRTIYNEVAAGRLRAARVGGRRELRFRAEWIDKWLDDTAPQELPRDTGGAVGAGAHAAAARSH